jgi:hypothetical protein
MMRQGQAIRDGLRRSLRFGAVAALALLATPALAADHDPCLTILDSLAAYTAAFTATGWQPPETDARRQTALRTLAEAQAVATTRPAIRTEAELTSFTSNARQTYMALFDRTTVLVKGDAAASLRVEAAGEARVLYCLIAGPHLPDVDAALAKSPAGGVNDVDFAGGALEPPEGATELRADLIRATFPIFGRSDFRGADAVFVTLKLAPAR